MESRISFWAALSLLVFSLLLYASAKAQPLKVEGYAIMSSDYATQFDGKYFTLQKKDGIAVVDLTGKTLASGYRDIYQLHTGRKIPSFLRNLVTRRIRQ